MAVSYDITAIWSTRWATWPKYSCDHHLSIGSRCSCHSGSICAAATDSVDPSARVSSRTARKPFDPDRTGSKS
jgi:hypothetical protein